MPEEALNVGQQWLLVDAQQRDRVAFSASSAGAPDAVHVVGRNRRQLEVDDVKDVLDVQPAGSTGNILRDNEGSGMDCWDASNGTGTPNTANTWINNIGADNIPADFSEPSGN